MKFKPTPRPDQPGGYRHTHRFRTVLNFSVGWKVIGDFQFSFQVNNNYDSQPPGTDAKNNDVSVVTSVGYTF